MVNSVEFLPLDDGIGYVPVMVCTAHMSFVPCRHTKFDSPCQTTSEGAKVESVRKYQQEDDNE